MTNQRIESGLRVSYRAASKAYKAVKIALVVSVAVLSLIGLYVVSSPSLRDAAIDQAQGQSETVAAPKAQ